MQDRYAGDLGDYLKFGLLRWLVPPDSPFSLPLGVVWYRTLVGAASAAHAQYLTGRLTALQHSPWAGELIVYRPG